MPKKTIIQISVISVCLLASGVVLYRGLFSGETREALEPAGNVSVETASPEQILPHGETFNIGKVFEKTKLQFGQVVYPLLNFSQDVGIDQKDLIQPLPTDKP